MQLGYSGHCKNLTAEIAMDLYNKNFHCDLCGFVLAENSLNNSCQVLYIVIEVELVGMGTKLYRIDLIARLEFNPHIDDILGKYIPF